MLLVLGFQKGRPRPQTARGSSSLGRVVLAGFGPGGGVGAPSDRVLVPGEAGELLLQGLEAGPLPWVPVPAGEHQLVRWGGALQGAGHAVARIHPQEGLVVGHACGDRAIFTLCTPPHSHLRPSGQRPGMQKGVQVPG